MERLFVPRNTTFHAVQFAHLEIKFFAILRIKQADPGVNPGPQIVIPRPQSGSPDDSSLINPKRSELREVFQLSYHVSLHGLHTRIQTVTLQNHDSALYFITAYTPGRGSAAKGGAANRCDRSGLKMIITPLFDRVWKDCLYQETQLFTSCIFRTSKSNFSRWYTSNKRTQGPSRDPK